LALQYSWNQFIQILMSIFKAHIQNAVHYRGGSTHDEQAIKKIYELSSNENLLGPSPKFIQAIKDNLHLLNEYSFHDDDKFRLLLARHSQNELCPDQFIKANSGMELLDQICRAFLDRGDEVILSSPTFMAYKSFAELQGARVIDVPLKSELYELDLARILSAINENTKILFIATPNNPTGNLIPKRVMDDLMDKIPGHVVVIHDEVYYHFVDRPDYPRALDYILQGKNLIGLHSFSKAYALAGIRLAYAFSTPEIGAYLHKLIRPFMINTLTMAAGIAALTDDAHIYRTRMLIAREKQWLYVELGRLGIDFLATRPISFYLNRR
jgi:histidinol-phosphate aminotransferase